VLVTSFKLVQVVLVLHVNRLLEDKQETLTKRAVIDFTAGRDKGEKLLRHLCSFGPLRSLVLSISIEWFVI